MEGRRAGGREELRVVTGHRHSLYSPQQIQEQIIEDIMSLEEKFGDTLGGMPYLESGMIAPQTVSLLNKFIYMCNLIEMFLEHELL